MQKEQGQDDDLVIRIPKNISDDELDKMLTLAMSNLKLIRLGANRFRSEEEEEELIKAIQFIRKSEVKVRHVVLLFFAFVFEF